MSDQEWRDKRRRVVEAALSAGNREGVSVSWCTTHMSGACLECERDLRARAERAEELLASCRTQAESHLRARLEVERQRASALAALGHCVEVLDDIMPCGHSGDEETGEHDADCQRCRAEAALAHAEEDGK